MDEEDLLYIEDIITRLKDKEMINYDELPCSCGNLMSENSDMFVVIKEEDKSFGLNLPKWISFFDFYRPKRYLRRLKCKSCGGYGGLIKAKKRNILR